MLSEKNFTLGFVVSLVLLAILPSTVPAGGLYLQEMATPSTGTASAGAQAWAHDASTAFHNPAGMTRVDGNQLMIGAGVLSSSVKFDASASTPYGGGNGGDAGGTLPMGSAHMVYSISEDLKLGTSLMALAGAALDYDDKWSGRYQSQSVELMVMFFSPSLAYKINERWSVAAGIPIAYGDLELEVAANLPGPLDDGKIKIDGDDTEITFNLSTMFEISDQTRIGLVYWYETELDFSGGIKLNLPGISFAGTTTILFPQCAKASIFHAVNEKIALLGSVGWEDWSRLGEINISTGKGSNALPRNWEDTYIFAVGLHYRVSDPWLLQCGISYTTSPVDKDDRTADMPIDRQIRYAVGALYSWSEALTIGGAFEYIDLGDAEISSNTLVGDYETNDMIVASLSFNWKF